MQKDVLLKKEINIPTDLKILTRTQKILCVSSRTEDDKSILIWDFDNIPLYEVLKSLSKTQKYHGLGIIYIFESNNGYNAVCLDKMSYKEVHHINKHTKYADYWHNDIGYRGESWAWRIANDKKYLKHLLPTDDYRYRIQSYAHKKFLELIFNLKVNWGIFDNYTSLEIESYKQDVI